MSMRARYALHRFCRQKLYWLFARTGCNCGQHLRHRTGLMNWNVVVCVYQNGFTRALHALQEFGAVERSPYYNVLQMKVEDPQALLAAIERRTEENPALYDAIS